MDFVAIDFETANSKRDSACSIGLTCVRNGEIAETLRYFIRPPELQFGWWQKRNLKFGPENLVDAPSLAELWPSLWHVIEDKLLVAHNASFDMSVLYSSLRAGSVELPPTQYLCSYQLARQAWPDLNNHKLKFLADNFGLQLEHHDAGSDARAAASVVLLAAAQRGHKCPIDLAHSLNVSIGRVDSDERWRPSSGPDTRREPESIEISIRDDYDVSQHPFYGKNVEFTEELDQLSRYDAMKVVTLFGGTTHDSVTKKTHFLVVGYLPPGRSTGKLDKARGRIKKGSDIRIISEADFMDLFLNCVNVSVEGY